MKKVPSLDTILDRRREQESHLLRRARAAEFLEITSRQFQGIEDRIPQGPPTPRGQRRYWIADLEKWKESASVSV